MKQTPAVLVNKKSHRIRNLKGRKASLLSRYSLGLRLKKTRNITYQEFEMARITILRATKKKKLFNTKNLKLLRSTRIRPPKYERPIMPLVHYTKSLNLNTSDATTIGDMKKLKILQSI